MSRPKTSTAAALGGSEKARRYAAAILSVLSGHCTTTEGSAMMGVTVPRYYALETRALEGMVRALEPRPRGRQHTPESELAAARKENARMTREVTRLATLVRASHRALGVKEAPKPVPGRRRRRRGDRAQRAVARLVPPTREDDVEKATPGVRA